MRFLIDLGRALVADALRGVANRLSEPAQGGEPPYQDEPELDPDAPVVPPEARAMVAQPVDRAVEWAAEGGPLKGSIQERGRDGVARRWAL